MREQEIQARYALEVAGAALNDALGEPLETPHDLSTPLVAANLPNASTLDSLDKTSVQERPDARQAGFDVALVQEATAAIDLDGSKKRMLTEMRQAGIKLNATA